MLALVAEGRDREARVLLDAYVRGHAPREAALSAEPDPPRLVPLLLRAARDVSEETHWDLVHALRVAGLAI
ncbi:UL36 very large tegument protein OS=Streptomyces fumanus OX=67302 GN=GCM10018772_69590 PE=4 SV=1 [Streptomyces fumanus]